MTAQVQKLLYSFNHLSTTEQREFAVEVFRQTRQWDVPPLEEDDLVNYAEELFLTLDKEEVAHG